MKKKLSYTPPYTVSSKSVNLIADIAAALERYKLVMEGPGGIRLRKINHIKTLRGTTAIEGNTLTEEEISTILEGKRIKGTKREVQEVRCAHRAYEMIEKVDPYSAKDLLKVHGVMTDGLVDRPGKWRNCNVGVASSSGKILHMAPPWDHVPFLMKDLFAWLNATDAHVLVKSCVFHYEFEFIHPFPDGNGRTGRYWQTAILGKWNDLFYAAPVENMVFSHQRQYYRAIRESGAKGDCGPFIEFMLTMILRTIKAKGVMTTQKATQKSDQKTTQKSDVRILAFLRENPKATRIQLAEAVGLSPDGIKWNLSRLKDAGRLRRIGPDRGGCWEVVS